MTVRKLKSILADLNDDDRIVIDNGDYFNATKENEIISVSRYADRKGGFAPVVVFGTRNDNDVTEEIKGLLEQYSEEEWQEPDAWFDLTEFGYKLEDFEGDPERYEWAKVNMENYGVI